MSGKHAMAVKLIDQTDGALHDACLVFADTLVRNAAAVIEGVKPAAIFSLALRSYVGGRWRQLAREALDEALRAYGRALPRYGIQIRVLYRSERRVFLLVWRPTLLTGALADGESLEILRGLGYLGSCERELVRELRRRLVAYYRSCEAGSQKQGFPHEIGLFLGYPAHDVKSFMAGEEALCTGAWKVYGDKHSAMRRFKLLKRHEEHCIGRFAAGEPLHALFAV